MVSWVSGASFINPSRTLLLAKLSPFRLGSVGRAEGEFPRFAEGHSDAHLSRLERKASAEGTSVVEGAGPPGPGALVWDGRGS